FQRPWGTLATSRSPCGAHPLSGAILVFIQVSSMKTRRSGSIRPCRFIHRTRRRAMSGRSRSLATTVFFEAEPLVVDEVPHRPIIDLEAPSGELGHEPAQGEPAFPDPPRQQDPMITGTRPGLVPAHHPQR